MNSRWSIDAGRLHPITWWVWAVALAVMAGALTNVVALLFLCAFIALVVRIAAPDQQAWTSFRTVAAFGLTLIAIRILLQNLFGYPMGGDVLFRLPQVTLPGWLSGLRVGGAVTAESLQFAFRSGSSMLVTVLAFAAAGSVVSAHRLLRALPSSLQSFGMVIIIAISFVPHLMADIDRIRMAARWRGQRLGRFRLLATNVVTVADSALDRSISLAGAMTSRGYSSSGSTRMRATYVGLLFIAGAVIGLGTVGPRLWLLPIAITGLGVVVLDLVVAQRYEHRSRYRADSWHGRDVAVIAGCVLAIASALAHLPVLSCALVAGCIACAVHVTPQVRATVVAA